MHDYHNKPCIFACFLFLEFCNKKYPSPSVRPQFNGRHFWKNRQNLFCAWVKNFTGSHTKRGWKRKISSWNFIKQKREKESFRIFLNTPKRCILYTDVKTISIHFHICTRSSILCWMFTFQFRMWKLGNLGKWGWGGKMGGVFFVLHRKLGGISHEFSPTRGEIRNGGLSVEWNAVSCDLYLDNKSVFCLCTGWLFQFSNSAFSLLWICFDLTFLLIAYWR